MKLLIKLLHVFFPPSRWNKCGEPTPWGRAARYERKLGEYRAEQVLKKAMLDQRIDAFTSTRVRPATNPKLPKDNVVSIKRGRKRA